MKYALRKQSKSVHDSFQLLLSSLRSAMLGTRRDRKREKERGGDLLGKLIGRPANGSTWHRCDNPGPDTLEKAPETLSSIQQLAAL